MASSPTTGDGPTTEHEFERRLGALLVDAHDNGVDVSGGWQHRDPADTSRPDWGVEVYEVLKASGS